MNGNLCNSKILDEKFRFECEIKKLPSENIEVKLNLVKNIKNSKLKNNLNEIFEFLKFKLKNKNLINKKV